METSSRESVVSHDRQVDSVPAPGERVARGRRPAGTSVDPGVTDVAGRLLRLQAAGGNQMVGRLLATSQGTSNGPEGVPEPGRSEGPLVVQRSPVSTTGTVSDGQGDIDGSGADGRQAAVIAQINGLLAELPAGEVHLTADELASLNANLSRLMSLTGQPIPTIAVGEAAAGVANPALNPALYPVAAPAIAEALAAIVAALAALTLTEILLILAAIVAIILLIVLVLRGALPRTAPAPTAPTAGETPQEQPQPERDPKPGPVAPVDVLPPEPKSPRRPRAIFGPVRAANTPPKMSDRIPDNGVVDVAVQILDWDPAMGPVQVAVDGSPRGGAADFAGLPVMEVAAPAAVLPVRGAAQSPVHTGTPLTLTARLGGTPIGASTGFAVAAIMQDMSTALVSLVNDASVGMIVSMSWQSDGVSTRSLDEIEFEEQLTVVAESGSLVGHGLGDHGTPNLGSIMPQPDYHLSRKNDVGAGPGSQIIQQVWAFLDNRTGSTGMTVRNSGFAISRVIEPDPSRPGKLHMIVTKVGQTGTVGAHSSDAGQGHAGVVIPLD
jgi:hypothetical protein